MPSLCAVVTSCRRISQVTASVESMTRAKHTQRNAMAVAQKERQGTEQVHVSGMPCETLAI